MRQKDESVYCHLKLVSVPEIEYFLSDSVDMHCTVYVVV